MQHRGHVQFDDQRLKFNLVTRNQQERSYTLENNNQTGVAFEFNKVF